MEKVSQGFNNDIDLSLAKPWRDVKNNYSRFADGDVIFAKITPCFQNRKSAIVDNTVNGIGCGSTEFITLRCSNLIFNKYLLWFVKCPYFINLGQSKFRGTAGQQRFAPKDVKSCLVPLPPLEEQRRIVAKLDELKPLVDQFGETYDKLSELEADFPRKLKASILQAAMQGKLVPQLNNEPAVEQIGPALDPDDVPFELPEEWKWVQLENLCTYMQRGKSPKYSDIKRYPVVAQKCNQWDGLHLELALFFDPSTLSSYKAERFLQQDDVLLNSTGTGTLGRVGSYDKEANPYELAVADSHVTVIRAKFSCLMPYYLKFVLRSDIFQRKLIAAGTGTTKQQELALSKVKQLWIPLPPLEEQRRIVARIEELFAEVDKMSACKAP